MGNRLLISHWPRGYHYTVGVAIVHIAPVKATLDDHAISGFRVLLFLPTRDDLNIIFPSRVPSITNRTTFIAYQPKSSSDESKNDQGDTPPQHLHYLWTHYLFIYLLFHINGKIEPRAESECLTDKTTTVPGRRARFYEIFTKGLSQYFMYN